MNYKFKKYWRKTGLNDYWGNVLLDLIKEKKPKHFLEIGVFCGVTSRNVCELLNIIHNGDFSYIGFDLFGEKINVTLNEAEPEYIKSQKFSNPLKMFYYNYFKKENLNSIESISNFLRKFENNIKLIKGDTNITLKNNIPGNIDFAFVDGGHSYDTCKYDIGFCVNGMKKKSVIICDDYNITGYGVKKVVDEIKNRVESVNILNDRLAMIVV